MKKTLLTTLLSAFCAFGALAADLKPGTYSGMSLNDEVTLYLQDVPGRSGSMYALITKEDTLGFVYLVDKFAANKYGMVPLQALENNVIGAANHTPSLVLTISEDRGYDRISIAFNDKGNKAGFSTPMSFVVKDKGCESTWISSLQGTFSYEKSKRAATITAQDSNREATLNTKEGITPGDYTLRESRPGIHLVLRSSLTTSGIEVTESTNQVAVFTKQGKFSKDRLMIMDTTSGKLTIYKLR